jgi:hypothetical protein
MREGGREEERRQERERQRNAEGDPPVYMYIYTYMLYNHAHSCTPTHNMTFQWTSGLLGVFSQKWSEGKFYYLEETVSLIIACSNIRTCLECAVHIHVRLHVHVHVCMYLNRCTHTCTYMHHKLRMWKYFLDPLHYRH